MAEAKRSLTSLPIRHAPQRTGGDGATREAFAKLQALEADHEVAKVGHDAVEQPGQQWLASGRLAPDETTRLFHNLRELQSIYERHIAVEDNEIFPLAARVFDAGMLNEAAREMTKRRGQRFESLLSFQHR